MQNRVSEASSSEWDNLYRRGATTWLSAGLSTDARTLLSRHARGSHLLEIGCGIGADAESLSGMGFHYLGLDVSENAVTTAKARLAPLRFECADFFKWRSPARFDVVYEKGVFHSLAGVRRRNSFLRRVRALLHPDGLWITVCGAADHRRSDFAHGAIYLRDLVGPAEVYFEVLAIAKGPYGLADHCHDFEAWHGVFRARGTT